jgi:ABC-type polysaccharide/polyol phosphate transport system ATPase subunit
MSVIEIQNVSKSFRMHGGSKLIREHLKEKFSRRERGRFQALRNVSFHVGRNEGVAILGANGAGKSTLLGIIAGVAQPDSGTVRVDGRVSALLELGSGFDPDLTGAENVYLNAALLGFTRAEVRQAFPLIHEFSEIGGFIYEPVRTFSAGMVLRLAFSVAIHARPDVLIVDEILGVGDARFQEKCARRIREMRARGASLLCVTHTPLAVLDYCSRAVWLHKGEVVEDGPAQEVSSRYLAFSAAGQPAPEAPRPKP